MVSDVVKTTNPQMYLIVSIIFLASLPTAKITDDWIEVFENPIKSNWNCLLKNLYILEIAVVEWM